MLKNLQAGKKIGDTKKKKPRSGHVTGYEKEQLQSLKNV